MFGAYPVHVAQVCRWQRPLKTAVYCSLVNAHRPRYGATWYDRSHAVCETTSRKRLSVETDALFALNSCVAHTK